MTERESIVRRIRAMMNISVERGATLAEAQQATDMVGDLMRKYGLEEAELSLKGEKGEERLKDGSEVVGLGREDWSRDLMDAIAESCFVDVRAKGDGKRLMGFSLIGRKSSVITTQLMFQYLYRTVIRLSRAEKGSQRFFRFGCAERIAQRIRERHENALAEQRQDASKNASGDPGRVREGDVRETSESAQKSNALVVFLEDYARTERDLNEDFRRGVAPGTTRRERDEANARRLVKQARREALRAEGVSEDLLFWITEWDMTLEEAKVKEEKYRQAQEHQSTKRQRPYRERVDPAERRRMSSSYSAGTRAGNNVGLDPQVGASAAKKLT